MYDIVHLIFCQPINKLDLGDLLNNTELTSCLGSVRAINLNLQTIDNNLFSLNFD